MHLTGSKYNDTDHHGLMINPLGQNLDYEYISLEGTFFPFVNNKSYEKTVMMTRGTKRPCSLDDNEWATERSGCNWGHPSGSFELLITFILTQFIPHSIHHIVLLTLVYLIAANIFKFLKGVRILGSTNEFQKVWAMLEIGCKTSNLLIKLLYNLLIKLLQCS